MIKLAVPIYESAFQSMTLYGIHLHVLSAEIILVIEEGEDILQKVRFFVPEIVVFV